MVDSFGDLHDASCSIREAMENANFLHLPTSIALAEPRLFWLLAHELYKSKLHGELDHLLDTDWSELVFTEDAEALAADLAQSLFASDDLQRLQSISEGFTPDKHPGYFRRLRDCGKKMPQSKKAIAWMQSQSLIGKGLDGFKLALSEGNVELAKTLHSPTAAEAETVFYELAPMLNKTSIGYLAFLCPALVGFKALDHAASNKAHEEVLTFLAWKIEETKDKRLLRNPDGDEDYLIRIITQALSRGNFNFAKKIMDWNHSLGFEKIEPRELLAPWPSDSKPIAIDAGTLQLTPSEFACLYGHDGLARALSHIKAPAPNTAKLAALIGALGRKLESRRPGSSEEWSAAQKANCESIAKALWRD